MLLVLNHNYLSQEQAIIQKQTKKKTTQFAVNVDYSEYMACESSTDVK